VTAIQRSWDVSPHLILHIAPDFTGYSDHFPITSSETSARLSSPEFQFNSAPICRLQLDQSALTLNVNHQPDPAKGVCGASLVDPCRKVPDCLRCRAPD